MGKTTKGQALAALGLATAGVQSGPGGFTNSWRGGQSCTVRHIHYHPDVNGAFSCCRVWDFGLFLDLFGTLELNHPG